MTVREFLSKNGVNTHKDMSAADVLKALSKIPTSMLSLIPGLSTAIMALKAANSVVSTARSTYETAVTTTTTAKKALDAFSAAKATSEGDPSGAAYLSAQAAEEATKLSLTAADNALDSATTKVTTTILDSDMETV